MNVDVPNEVIAALAEARAMMRAKYDHALQVQGEQLATARDKAASAQADVAVLRGRVLELEAELSALRAPRPKAGAR